MKIPTDTSNGSFPWLRGSSWLLGLGFCSLHRPAHSRRIRIKLQKESSPVELIKALHDGNVQIKGDEFADSELADVLSTLAKRHGVAFVVMEEQFKAKRRTNLKQVKSALKFDTKGLTLHAFLNVWLSSLDAMYRVRPDYLEIVPFAASDESSAKLVAQPTDALSALLEKLHGQEVELPNANVKEIPLLELLQQAGQGPRPDLRDQRSKLQGRRDGGCQGYNSERDRAPGPRPHGPSVPLHHPGQHGCDLHDQGQDH